MSHRRRMELALNTMSNTVNCLTKQIEQKDAEIARLREQLARGSFSAEEAPTKTTKAKKVKKEKDPNALKKPSTAWMMWKNAEFAPAFKISNPGESIAKASGLAWKALSAEEKEPWEAKYRAAKAEYDAATGKSTAVKKVVTISEEEPSIYDQIENETENGVIESAEDSDNESSSSAQPDPELPIVSSHEETKEERRAKKKAEKKEAKAAAKRAEKLAKKEAKKEAKKAEKAAKAATETIIEEAIVEEIVADSDDSDKNDSDSD